MEWSLLVSYRLPLVTVYNITFIGLTIFFMQHFSLVYLCFFSGVINHGIYRNLTRRFSIDKFYEYRSIASFQGTSYVGSVFFLRQMV
ncbi:hypothetical protein UA3_02265 [Enterococcus faecium EnGen0263]|uniref:hypothetical protein n=1 Tax=Enterococcus TaxID=1350 RepID=UPI0003311955|nr:hypothetical protein [Enterococcus faecium]EOH54450.1 hypothetical protein UA3_02265 [Enterococcus faecium EnGen0263]OTO23288.1 hypothetical protein A5816_002249 [Enterococcus sp. 3G1_DIV0629]